MKRSTLLLVVVMALAGVATLTATTSRQATAHEVTPIFVKKIPPGYRDWKVVSVAHEAGDLNDIRAVLGNDIAIKAYREGKLPFPEGAIVGRIAWSYVSSEENNKTFGRDQSFVAGSPTNFYLQFMVKDLKKFDLMVLAFWTDSTRLSTFMFANDVSGKNFSKLVPGAAGSHHDFSHHQNKAEKYEPYSKINRWHAEQLAYFMTKLKRIKEGERTLLDNSMVLFGSSFSDGNRHDPNNLPIVLAGRGGGKIKSGRHVACEKN